MGEEHNGIDTLVMNNPKCFQVVIECMSNQYGIRIDK